MRKKMGTGMNPGLRPHRFATSAILASIVVFLCVFTSPPHATARRGSSVESLTEGVSELSGPGAPGPLCVFGKNADVLVTGGRSGNESALVAAAPAGRGRIVAFGHNGYFDREALDTADTARLMENAIVWCAGTTPTDRAQIRLATLRGDGNGAHLSQYLSRNGWRGVELPRKNLTEELADVDVLCLDPGTLRGEEKEEEIAAIQRYIESGGGCIAASLGWGWLQLNAPHTIHEHPGNLLLGKYGICWADGMCGKTSGSGYRVASPSPLVNASTAFLSLDRQDFQSDGAAQRQISVTLSMAAQTVPPSSSWRKRLQRL
ncbi:MAG: hypothetical protein Q4C47_05115, partial [Planctomycetia bacterium]|nr:hypothetical protein [Planctomycetia bacterium]